MTAVKTEILQNLSVDCVIFGFQNSSLEVLLIKLNVDPAKGQWALPGANIHIDEDLDQSAARVLEELTGVKNIFMEQLAAHGEINRYPNVRIITISYCALIKPEQFKLSPGIQVSEVKWFQLGKVPQLAYDHQKILDQALNQLKKNIRYRPIGFELLPKKFTLTDLQTLYESILERQLDKRNFRKKILAMSLLKKLDEKKTGVAHRRPHLYSFDKKNYKMLKQKGFNFEL